MTQLLGVDLDAGRSTKIGHEQLSGPSRVYNGCLATAAAVDIWRSSMKPTWKGSISFGLVHIPIALFPATDDKDVHFNLLHKEDEGRLQNQRVCSVCHKVVPYSDVVKGYEYKKGEYVIMTDEDFKKVSTPSNESIAIEDFVEPGEIDPIYY